MRPLHGRCREPIIQADSLEGPGRGAAWGQEGVTLHGQPLGPEDKMLCLILPMAPKDGVIIFLSWQAWEGELRKVKWAGQDHTVSVCQKWGSLSGVFNTLLGVPEGTLAPSLPLMWDQVPFQLHRGLTLFLVEFGHQEAQIRNVGCLLPEPQPESMCRQGSAWGEQADGPDSASETTVFLPIKWSGTVSLSRSPVQG